MEIKPQTVVIPKETDRLEKGKYGPIFPKTPASANPTSPLADTWVSVALTYQRLKALGVPQDSLDTFVWEFRQGMGARAKESASSSTCEGDSSTQEVMCPCGNVAGRI